MGYYYDEEIGTYYVRARNYSSTMARWLNQDPLFWPSFGRHGVEAQNVISYSLNSPALFTDASGQSCVVCRWRRESGAQSLATADGAFVPPQRPYLALAFGQFGAANNHLGRNGWDASHTMPPTEMGHSQAAEPDGTFVDNGFLFFISADVCESKPGDCLVSLKETPWRARSTGADQPWRLEDTGGHFVDFSDRVPTPWPPGQGATNPFIADLKQANSIHGGKCCNGGTTGCNKRIVLGDFTRDSSTIGHGRLGTGFAAWGAQVVMRIYDRDGNNAQMNYKFDAWTQRNPPYGLDFNLTGEVISPSNNQGP